MDTTEVLIKIRKIVRSINLESKKIQKEHGVSIPQVLCLNFLQSSPGFQATQGQIRKFLQLNSSTMNGIIHRLENKGFIVRLPKTGDKRAVNIALTTDGLEQLKKIPSLLHDQLYSKLQQLDRNDIRKVHDGLDILIQILNISEIDASPMLTVEGDINE